MAGAAPHQFDMSKLPFQPVRFEWDFPYFSSADLEIYGLPDHYGLWRYGVIEDRCFIDESAKYGEERCFDTPGEGWVWGSGKLKTLGRPKHHYDRVERMQTIMYQLLGVRGRVSDELVELVRENLFTEDPRKMWEAVEKILRENGYGRFFNRIPYILSSLGYPPICVRVTGVEEALEDFKRMSKKFDGLNNCKKYFPHMRFVGLRLLLMNGVCFNYLIPLIKTESKVVEMMATFDKLFY